MMSQQHDVHTPYVRKVIPLCELAPFAMLGCGWFAFLIGATRGAIALGLFGLGMWAANCLRACCQWYNARHPDETGH
jgi:hypothetical protein